MKDEGQGLLTMLNATEKSASELPTLVEVKEPQLLGFFRRQSTAAQMKRVGDIVMAWLLLTITSPLMLIVAAAIKCESAGPVLEREPCIGDGGRRFQMLNFRVHHADETRSAWAHPMTRIGQLLRYTRIEHLPQLINVLRGEMGILDDQRRSPSFLS